MQMAVNGLSGCIGFVSRVNHNGLISRNNLVDHIGLVNHNNLVDFSGHNGLVGFISLVDRINLIELIGLVGLVVLICLIYRIGLIYHNCLFGFGLVGVTGHGLMLPLSIAKWHNLLNGQSLVYDGDRQAPPDLSNLLPEGTDLDPDT